MSQETISSLYAPVTVGQQALKEGAKSEEELGQTVGLVYIMLFVIYFSVIMYASMIAMEVATEKIFAGHGNPDLKYAADPANVCKAAWYRACRDHTACYYYGAGSLSLKLNQKSETASSVGGFLNLTDVSATTVIYAVIFFCSDTFCTRHLPRFSAALSAE